MLVMGRVGCREINTRLMRRSTMGKSASTLLVCKLDVKLDRSISFSTDEFLSRQPSKLFLVRNTM